MALITSGLTSKNLITRIRQDLIDLDPANYRWTDDVLARSIDRAVEKYTYIAPLLELSQIPTIPGSRLYATPDGAWYVTRAEYPTGFWPKRWRSFRERESAQLPDPTQPLQPLAERPSGPLTGAYQYAYTFTTPGPSTGNAGGSGETLPSPIAALTLADQAGSLSAIPPGPYGTTGRTLYRSQAGGTTLYLLHPIGDNTTSSYLDTTPDGSLSTTTAPTENSTAGIPQLELDLTPSQLPTDASGIIELTCAYKHHLDQLGTTIPEQHWPDIALGAEAFALYAYLTTTNDNFDYVDGQFRDRVDDSKAPLAWMAQAKQSMDRFEVRLAQIRNEFNATTPEIPQWGDKPARWERL